MDPVKEALPFSGILIYVIIYSISYSTKLIMNVLYCPGCKLSKQSSPVERGTINTLNNLCTDALFSIRDVSFIIFPF